MTRRVEDLGVAGADAGGQDVDGGVDLAGALDLAGSRALRTFEGVEPTAGVLAAIAAGRASGVTLFRRKNIGSPEQVRALCAALQAARPAGDPALVIGIDQEGGQLQAIGHGATAWPGSLALGAAGSDALAEAAGEAIGREVAALGATLVFAPVCDVLRPSSATPLGTRAFGSDPASVARLAAATVRGIQRAGVAAVLKHFPGHGGAVGDSHMAMPVVADDADTLRSRDLLPFRAGVAAGAAAVLPGHLAVPALTGGVPVAATVSPAITTALLRTEMGFDRVTVSDALDMGGAGAAADIEATVVAAASAGIDLMLLVHDEAVEEAAVTAISHALARGAVDPIAAAAARDRIARLRSSLPSTPPFGLEVVGCAEHLALARRIAEASVTLVRDPRAVLDALAALQGASGRVALLAPVPVDLTPAETSSAVRLVLADTLRERGIRVEELVVPLDPTPAEVAALAAAADGADVTVVATFDAVSHRGEADLVTAVARRGPTLAVALRSPYDIALFPPDVAAAATYGVQPPQAVALADALMRRIPFRGRLPVELAVVLPDVWGAR